MTDLDIKYTIVLITLLVVILLGGVVIAYFVMGRQKNRQQQRLAETQLEHERKLRKQEMDLAEQLMTRFARELHDGMGHELTCLRLELENLKLDQPTFETHLNAFDSHLAETSHQLKHLSRTFNTDFISGKDFSEMVTIELSRQERIAPFEFEFIKRNKKQELKENQKTALFRILQEVLTNAVKHSKATKVTIELGVHPDKVLKISDDGVGFDPQVMINSGKASGLRNIMKRAELAGFKCNVKSELREGTSYSVSL